MKDHKQNRTLQTHFTYITLILKSSSIYFTVLQNNIHIFSQCSSSSYHTILTFFHFEQVIIAFMSRESIRTRILRQINQTEERPAKGVHLALNPNSDTVMGWIAGPQGSDYDDGLFQVEIDYHTDPKIPPRIPPIRFVTKIYHPNIS
jgi:hypothetical protein